MKYRREAAALFALLAGVLLLACTSSDESHVSFSSPAEADSGYVATPAGPIYYERNGEGRPIILLHGGNLDRRLWDPQFVRLADSFQVVRYDIRPFGRSPPASQPYSELADLRALLDSLEIGTATLVGLSVGGRIAIDFALTHPKRVEQLVLVGSGLGGFEFSGQEALFGRLGAAYERGGIEALVEEWLRDPYMAPAMRHADLAPTLRRIAQENGPAWLPSSRPHPPEPLSPPAIDRLTEIDAAALIVVGELDVPDIHETSRLLDERIPESTLVTIPDAGHIVNLEAPEQFERALFEFLATGAHG